MLRSSSCVSVLSGWLRTKCASQCVDNCPAPSHRFPHSRCGGHRDRSARPVTARFVLQGLWGPEAHRSAPDKDFSLLHSAALHTRVGTRRTKKRLLLDCSHVACGSLARGSRRHRFLSCFVTRVSWSHTQSCQSSLSRTSDSSTRSAQSAGIYFSGGRRLLPRRPRPTVGHGREAGSRPLFTRSSLATSSIRTKSSKPKTTMQERRGHQAAKRDSCAA